MIDSPLYLFTVVVDRTIGERERRQGGIQLKNIINHLKSHLDVRIYQILLVGLNNMIGCEDKIVFDTVSYTLAFLIKLCYVIHTKSEKNEENDSLLQNLLGMVFSALGSQDPQKVKGGLLALKTVLEECFSSNSLRSESFFFF
jgi:hypothetical protein